MSSKSIQTFFTALLLATMILGLGGHVSAMQAPAPAAQTISQPEITYDVQHDVSAPWSELALSQASPNQPASQQEIPLHALPKALNAASGAVEPDTALQSAPVTGSMPTLVANFDGVNNLAGVAPPDTEGDIGYDPGTGQKYYMQWVNLHIQAWNVTNPASPMALFPSPIAGTVIWSGFGGRCATDNTGDPIVLYDELANRWMISQFAVNSAPYYNCIAVSASSDPSGSWYRYAFQYSATKMNDYPKYGIWPNGYYMTVNQFVNAQNWGGAGVAVYERSQMLQGLPARQVIIDLYSANPNFGGMLPADFEGTPPPDGTPAYFAEVDDSTYGLGTVDEMRIWNFQVDWASNTFNFGVSNQPNQILPVTNYNLLCGTTRDCIPQPGTTAKLDAVADRVMYRLAYRVLDSGGERMVVNHTVDAGSGRAGVRWYQLDKSGGVWAITQQGTYAGDAGSDATINRWMGSISMDHAGNLALGYSMSSGASTYPSLGLVGRLNSDPPNSLPQGELVAFAGSASQTGTNRWGDYSSMSVDPQDSCTFWYTNEYSSGGWNWRTRIVAFKYPSCGTIPTGTITGTVTDTGGAPISGATVQTGVISTTTAPDGSYTLTVPAGTYNVTASAYGYQPGTNTGLLVSGGGNTISNFTLTAAVMSTVSGVVSDATLGGHAWPLYAKITIAGYPYGDIFTNPQTGFYSVNLPQGQTFGFSVSALAAGYDTITQNVLVPAGNLTQNFGLTVNQVTCSAPGYTTAGAGFKETFDGVTAPSLPANWAYTSLVTIPGGPAGLWATNAGTREPAGIPAFSTPNVAYFNSWDTSSGTTARLAYTIPFNMTTVAPDQVSFQMYHDAQYSSSLDSVQITVSTDGGANWVLVGPVFDRPVAPASVGWAQHTVDLSAYGGATNLLIGFLGTSKWGNDVHIDDVTVGATSCVKQAGGLLYGNVKDANTLSGLVGATVSPTGAPSIVTTLPADPAQTPGFYYGFVPAGTNVNVIASMAGPYSGAGAVLNVADNAVIKQDFFLAAGQLNSTPTSFDVWLTPGSTTAQNLTLYNTGLRALNFQISEINAPYALAPQDPILDPVMRHLGPKNLDKLSLAGVAYYLDLNPAALQPYPNLAAGTVLSSFASGLAMPWGVGVDQVANTVWIGNPAGGGGDDLDHEFTTAGAITGKTITTAPWRGVFAADMAYDSTNKTLWQVDVGGDNCIHELSLTGLTATGNKICPVFGTSERGLAYDPVSDTFFAGSWNDSLIKRFDRSGNILQQVNVALPISGLAYNPSTGHLFVMNQIAGTPDITVLDVHASYAVLGSFDVTGMGDNQQAGLEFTCDGHLWAANQTTGIVMEIDSGETGVCSLNDIPWLSEAVTSGTIAGSGVFTPFPVTFDATGLAVGTYQGQLRLANDTPYAPLTVNVTLHVSDQVTKVYLPIVRK